LRDKSEAMTTPSLDERRKEVLRSLVELHVETGEPVGSESLARTLHRSLSPATLRNLMADLEALGYLEQPHTSAGRMPTDEGYRFYVDSLMGTRPLAAQDAAAIQSGLRRPDTSANQVLESASRILSRLSRQVGFVVVPDMEQTSFRHLDLVRLAHPRILVVMVSMTGIVTNKVVEIEEQLSQDQLQHCANYLNAEFAGMSLAKVRARLLELMTQEKALYDSLLQRSLSLGQRAFAPEADEAGLYLDGAVNMLSHPEFEDLERMRALFRTFEEKSRLVKILNACISGDGVRVLIGHENPDPELKDLSLVSASYPAEGEASWSLGVLGSTRMEYARVVALVDHVARSVSEILRERHS
jgi:heat-inducible transcriptional repressor